MSTGNKYSAIMISNAWSHIVAAMTFLTEYVSDYLSGQKYKAPFAMQHRNQKQK